MSLSRNAARLVALLLFLAGILLLQKPLFGQSAAPLPGKNAPASNLRQAVQSFLKP